MPTYIDESGDTGSHPQSSPHFRLAAVWFETAEMVDVFTAGLGTLCADLKLPPRYEFHFTHAPPHLRTAYLRFVAAQPLRYTVCSVSKGESRETLPKEVLIRAAVRGATGVLREWYELAEGCKTQPQPDCPRR